MKSQVRKLVLEILARYRGKFVMCPDILAEALKSREARHIVDELKHRGHRYGMNAKVTEDEIEEFVSSNYRREMVTILYVLRQKGCVEETAWGKKDEYQAEILKLGAKIAKKDLGYRITERGLSDFRAGVIR